MGVVFCLFCYSQGSKVTLIAGADIDIMGNTNVM